MKTIKYRDYTISYELRTRWLAQIKRPGAYMIMKDGMIRASAEEGEEVLLARCRARIDQEEGKRS
jgi:hypothetical protein